MPKENTHLYFAGKILEKNNNPEIITLLKINKDFFFLGSTFPDIFLYERDLELFKIHQAVHGENEQIVNELLVNFLQEARRLKSKQDLVFIFGFLSHCALDSAFHPIVNYFTGNTHDANRRQMERARYLHCLLETSLDKKVNHVYFYNDLVKVQNARSLGILKVFLDAFHITRRDLMVAFFRQYWLFKIFVSQAAYQLAKIFYEAGYFLKEKADLAVFYGSLKDDSIEFPSNIIYKDVFNGDNKKTTVDELFNRAAANANNWIGSAYLYYHGEIGLETLKTKLRVPSLSTGDFGKHLKDIKYSRQN